MIRNVPIPTAGVMLGLAALGNLLAPWSLLLKYACGLGAVDHSPSAGDEK